MTSTLLTRATPILGALVLASATRVYAQGCAMCGNSIAPDDPVANAISSSVLFLMAAPYSLFAVAATWWFLAHRRQRSQRRARVIPLRPGRQPSPCEFDPVPEEEE